MPRRILDAHRLRGSRGQHLGWPIAIVLRSLYPLLAIALLLGTIVWGPWVTLAASILAWNAVTRCA
jgi:hypothetical protein